MRWWFAVLFVIQAHFCASFLVPLDTQAKSTFGGLLGWAWPWGIGDSGLAGTRDLTVGGMSVPVFFVAMLAAAAFIVAALSVFGWLVPAPWWRYAAFVGAVASLFVMAMYFGPTKLIPIAGDLAVIWLVLSPPALVHAG